MVKDPERDWRVAAEIAVATRAKAKVKVGRDERQTREPAVGPVSSRRDSGGNQSESRGEGRG